MSSHYKIIYQECAKVGPGLFLPDDPMIFLPDPFALAPLTASTEWLHSDE